MPIETHVYAAGAWRRAKEIYVKDGSNWRNLKEVWVKEEGIWKKVFTKFFEFNADISGLNYNLRDACLATGQWDGITPVLANLRVVGNLGAQPPVPPPINPDANADYNVTRRQMMANYANYPAFDSGSLPAGSEITLTVMPGVYLVGAGGEGGNHYVTTRVSYMPNQQLDAFPWFFENGGSGSPAIRTTVKTTIINNGVIGGGGGGGAGGIGAISQSYWSGKPFNSFTQGGMGGGGAGYVPGTTAPYSAQGDAPRSNYGYPGTLTTGGAGGTVWSFNNGPQGTPGGRGGDLGQPGGNGGSQLPADVSAFPRHVRTGGPPGAAVIGSANVVWQAYGDVRGPLT